MTTSSTPSPRAGIPVGLVFAAIVVLAINLRGGASSVGPLLAEITAGLSLNFLQTGILTGLPGLCFGLIGFVAVRVATRFGLSLTILVSGIFLTIGLGIRPWVDSPTVFLIFSVLALSGIALGNVLAPAWIKSYGGSSTVRLMSIYSALLVASGTFGSLLAAPAAKISAELWGVDAGWRGSLMLWSLTGLLVVLLWVFIPRRTGYDFPRQPSGQRKSRPVWKSRLAWSLTGLFGVQSMHAYIQFGWIPQIYRDAGLSATNAGLLLALISGLGVIGGALMPVVVARSKNLTWWMVLFGACVVVGYWGLYFAPVQGAVLWAFLLGVSGCAFAMAIALIPGRSQDPLVTAKLSGFVQPVGYLLAALGPVVIGVTRDAVGSWDGILLVLAATGVVMTLVALPAAKPRTVDAEIS